MQVVQLGVQANIALGFQLSRNDLGIHSGFEIQMSSTTAQTRWTHGSGHFYALGPWPSRAELWDDAVAYANAAEQFQKRIASSVLL